MHRMSRLHKADLSFPLLLVHFPLVDAPHLDAAITTCMLQLKMGTESTTGGPRSLTGLAVPSYAYKCIILSISLSVSD